MLKVPMTPPVPPAPPRTDRAAAAVPYSRVERGAFGGGGGVRSRLV